MTELTELVDVLSKVVSLHSKRSIWLVGGMFARLSLLVALV